MSDPIYTERDLIQKYKEASDAVKQAKDALAKAEADQEYFEFMLLDRFEALGTTKTGEYSDIGHVTVLRPKVYASCDLADRELLFNEIRAAGRDDLIKETIASAALSGYVGEILDDLGTNQELTEAQRENLRKILRLTSVHLKPSVRLYSPKKQKASKSAVTLEVE